MAARRKQIRTDGKVRGTPTPMKPRKPLPFGGIHLPVSAELKQEIRDLIALRKSAEDANAEVQALKKTLKEKFALSVKLRKASRDRTYEVAAKMKAAGIIPGQFGKLLGLSKQRGEQLGRGKDYKGQQVLIWGD